MNQPLDYLSASLLSRVLGRFLLYPSRHRIDPAGAIQRDIVIDNAVLSIWVARSRGCAGREPAIFVLELSGNGSRAERFTARAAQRWGHHPVEVWGLNYPGFGSSTGPATLVALTKSALIAFDAIEKVAAHRPVLLGCHSIGCAVGLHVAAHRTAAGLILLNPPPLRQLLTNYFGWFTGGFSAIVLANHIPATLDSLANARKCRVPAIFYSSEKDRTVPPRFQRRVFAAYRGPRRWVSLANAGHSTFPDPAEPVVLDSIAWLLGQLNVYA
jgi:fermentation-respiration switch protein FrsA (DUF1100 family)